MKISRRTWYRLLALTLVGVIYSQRQEKDLGKIIFGSAVNCLIEQRGDVSFCPRLTFDPLIQQSIQKKFEQEFDQIEIKDVKENHDGEFEAQVHSARGTGITLVAIRISKTNFQVVGWRDLELGGES